MDEIKAYQEALQAAMRTRAELGVAIEIQDRANDAHIAACAVAQQAKLDLLNAVHAEAKVTPDYCLW